MSCYWCCKVKNRIAVFFGFKRKLCGQWTVEDVGELEIMHGLDVEQELANILTEEINKEMVSEYGPNWKEDKDREIIKAIKEITKENKL